MNKQQLKDGIINIFSQAQKQSNIYLEKIFIKIKEIINSQEDKSKDIIDLIYNSLEDTISLTIDKMSELYTINDKIIKPESLVWNKDGKTLEERVKMYVKQHLNQLKEEKIDKKIIKSMFEYEMTRILNTETNNTVIQTIKQKIYVEDNEIEVFEIIGGEDCDHCCAEYCDGDYHTEEEFDIPPYHPNCNCIPIFNTIDKDEL